MNIFINSVPAENHFQPPLLQAATGTRPSTYPVWFMRQAGRSLPEYRQVRRGVSMLDSCLIPDLAAEITCQPVRRHGVDGAVFFSDIMVPLKLAGVDVEIVSGIGPVLGKGITSPADVNQLVAHQIVDTKPIVDAVRAVSREIGPNAEDPTAPWTPILAFAGAPFTLAAYLVEGKPSRDHLRARTLMHADPKSWHRLMQWCAQISTDFARAQIEGGAHAFQLFDSWAGSLSETDYRKYVQPYSAHVLREVKATGVPVIHFGTGTAQLLPAMVQAGADIIGVDERIGLDQALAKVGTDIVVQGNIDPARLAAPWEVLREHTLDVIARGRLAKAHILNLGHGVPPTTDPTVLTRLVEYIHSLPA